MSWSEQKEVVKTNKSILFLLWLIKVFPEWFVCLCAFPVSFFFWLFAPKVRKYVKIFQMQLKAELKADSETASKTELKIKINTYKTILSFSLALIEKMEGWLGKISYEKLITHDDDLQDIIKNLNEGKGAFVIASHLGNIELLRSLSSFNRTGVEKEFPVLSIIEGAQTEQFTKTLKIINPNSDFNVIDASEIGPESIIQIEEHIEKGGLVVIAGDRTSAHSENRNINHSFLGKNAKFPYGVFLLPFLVKKPVYYMFGLRSKSATIFPQNHMFIHKSALDFENISSRKNREEKISTLCDEFVMYLEKYAKEFPYQWYNFYNFWE